MRRFLILLFVVMALGCSGPVLESNAKMREAVKYRLNVDDAKLPSISELLDTLQISNDDAAFKEFLQAFGSSSHKGDYANYVPIAKQLVTSSGVEPGREMLYALARDNYFLDVLVKGEQKSINAYISTTSSSAARKAASILGAK